MAEKPTQKKKTKGPIRWGGFVPIVALATITAIYFTFFFDGHLKRTLEYLGTSVNGARVDIETLKTSFFNGTFALKKLEITDKNEPMKNVVEVGAINFGFLVGPLLSKKFVTKQATIEDIRYGTQREKSGEVPESMQPARSSLAERLTKSFYNKFKDEIDSSPLAQLGSLLSADALTGEFKNLESASLSLKKIEELNAQIDQAQTKWNNVQSNLPGKADADRFEARINQVSRKKFNNPPEILAGIKEVQSIRNDVQGTLKRLQDAQNTVTNEANSLSKNIASIDQTINEDIKALSKKIKLPNLDLKDITPQLLGPKLMRQIERLTYWVALTRKYMPKKKKGETEQVVTRKRDLGTDVHFGSAQRYPTLLVAKAGIDSALSSDLSVGRVKGEIIDLTSEPPILGRPTLLNLTASFPKNNIRNARIGIEIDHTTEIAKETFKASVASFPVEALNLSESGDLKLAITKAEGTGRFQITYKEDSLNAVLEARLKNIEYKTESANRKAEQLIKRVVAKIPAFGIRAKVSGPFDDLNFSASSDLGSRMASGIKQEFQGQIKATQEKLRRQVNRQVKAERTKVEDKFEKTKRASLGPINNKVNQFKNIQNRAQSEINKLQNQQKKMAEGKLKKEADKLKNKIKIPGF